MIDEKTMLIDCHAHTAEVSPCCKSTAEEVLIATKKRGVDGIILTNHYADYYVLVSKIYADAAEMAKKHLEEYEYTKALGDKHGLSVFFGVEISMSSSKGLHMLVYGVDEKFMYDNLHMYSYSQEELYHAVKEAGGALVQAHPMRGGKNLLVDPKFLDGVELSSNLNRDGTHCDELERFAHENGLILTSGGDYHGDSPRPHCGMYLPNSIKDTKDFARYLLNTDSVHLRMQESKQSESYEKIFVRNKGE